MPNDSLFFESEHDVFGKSGAILSLDENSTIIIPKTSSIEDTTYTVSYDLTQNDLAVNPNALAKVIYTFNDVPIGNALLCYAGSSSDGSKGGSSHTHTTYINVKYLFVFAVVFVLLTTLICSVITRVHFSHKYTSKSDRMRYRRRKKEYKKGHVRF